VTTRSLSLPVLTPLDVLSDDPVAIAPGTDSIGLVD
jgi:hypothetical protein